MLRIILIQLLLFAIPFVVWALYTLLMRRKAAVAGPMFNDAPYAWLIVAGVGCMAAGLVWLAVFSGTPGEGTYVPPRYEDGRIIPGHVVPADEPVPPQE